MKTRRKIFVTGGLLLAMLLAVLAILLPKQKVQRTYAAEYDLTGLGMGIDVATAKELNEFKTTYQIFDPAKIQNLDWGKTTLNKSESKTISTTDIKKVVTELGAGVDASVGVEFPIGSVGKSINVNNALKYSTYAYKYFYVLDHRVERFQRFLFNSNEQSTYADCYTSAFLTDLNNLQSGIISYNSFFQKYGTHVVGKAVYGGRLDAVYSVVSNEIAIHPSVETAMKDTVSLGISDDLKLKITSGINTKLGMEFTQSDIETNFNVSARGGSVPMGNSINGFNTGYENWCKSFNDDSQSTIIYYPQDGLVPVWRLLPSGYSNLASAMESAYNAYYNSAANDVLEEFKSLNLNSSYQGTGTADNPYLIRSEQDLKNIPNKGMNRHYALASDVTLTGTDWEPIGGVDKTNTFNGTLNGRGYKIKNLSEDVTYDNKEVEVAINGGNKRIYFGLFGDVGSYATIKNLAFESVLISIEGPGANNDQTRVMVGVLAATFYGKAQNIKVISGACTYTKLTNGISYVGGLVGFASGATFKNCVNCASLFSGRYSAAVGGICGYAKNSEFNNCTNYGSLTARCTAYGGYAASGGMVGQSYSSTSNAFNSCNNYGTKKTYTYSSYKLSATYYSNDFCAMTNGKDLAY